MNKKAQALVEFIIILPILILLIFSFLDFGKIMLCKSKLENIMNTVSMLDEDEINNYLRNIKDYKINYEIKQGEYKQIILKTKLELITPGLKNILHNPYEIMVERSVLDE